MSSKNVSHNASFINDQSMLGLKVQEHVLLIAHRVDFVSTLSYFSEYLPK